jgi:hypothetical protein
VYYAVGDKTCSVDIFDIIFEEIAFHVSAFGGSNIEHTLYKSLVILLHLFRNNKRAEFIEI